MRKNKTFLCANKMQIKPEWHIFFEATAHLINALLHQPSGNFHWLGPWMVIFNFMTGQPRHDVTHPKPSPNATL